jgi:hypothetical protein
VIENRLKAPTATSTSSIRRGLRRILDVSENKLAEKQKDN